MIGAGRERAGTILAAIYVRIPMSTPDDQRGVQPENAREDARFCEFLQFGEGSGNRR
jgi:hypothetical protein